MEKITTTNGELRFKEKVYLSNGKTITKTFFRKTDATNWKRDNEFLKRREPDFFNKPNHKITFETLFCDWMNLKIRNKRSRKTIIQYDKFHSKHFRKHFSTKLISEIKTADVDKFVSYLIDLGLKPKSVNNVLTLLKQVFKYAFLEELIKTNPSTKVEYVNESQAEVEYFNVEEIQALLNTNKLEEIYPILIVGFNTGLRLGEILGIFASAVNFDQNTILICRKATRYGLEEHTKNRKIRYVPMNAVVRNVMVELMQKQRHPNLVFTTKAGEMLNPDHFSSRDFLKAIRRAGIRKLKFHCTRHSFASHFMMRGGNIYSLQKLLGHSDLKSTLIYAHLSPNHLAEVSRVVNFDSNISSDLNVEHAQIEPIKQAVALI